MSMTNSQHLGNIYSYKIKMIHHIEQKQNELLIQQLKKKKKQNKQ